MQVPLRVPLLGGSTASSRVRRPLRKAQGPRAQGPDFRMTSANVSRTVRGRDPVDVTVVVPTKNSGRTLAACLESLRAQTLPCRIVVVDNGSTDGTTEIARAKADFVASHGPERSAQRNFGARAYPAPFLGFIDADMVLEPEVVEQAVDLLRQGAGSVIVPERTIGTGFWVEVRAFERSFYERSDAIEAPRFFSWEAFESAGGFDENLTGAEDWDLGIAARGLAPVARTTALIWHDEGNLTYVEACRKKAYYAGGVRHYLAKHGIPALLQAGRRPWLSQPWRLANRKGVGLIMLKAGEALAIGAVWGRSAIGASAERWPSASGLVPAQLAGTLRRIASSTCPTRQTRRITQTWIRLWQHVRTGARVYRGVRHGLSTLAKIAVGTVAPRIAQDVTFETQDGLRVSAPSRHYHWFPVVEVVIDDRYRLGSLAPVLRGPHSRVFDIGAHVGAFSCALARVAPSVTVIAVEPSAERVTYLRRNIQMNCLAERVTMVQAAVGGERRRSFLSRVGVLEGHVDPDTGGEWVDVVTLGELFGPGNDPIGLVKLDCEGSEYEIFGSTSAELLDRIERLLLEYHPAPTDRIEQLFARLACSGLVERWRQDYEPGQVGIVYLEREST